jgi:hypothetical protein
MINKVCTHSLLYGPKSKSRLLMIIWSSLQSRVNFHEAITLVYDAIRLQTGTMDCAYTRTRLCNALRREITYPNGTQSVLCRIEMNYSWYVIMDDNYTCFDLKEKKEYAIQLQ